MPAIAGNDGARLITAINGFDGGLVTNYPPHAIDADQSPDAENFDPSARYKLKKRTGTTNFTGDHGTPTGTLIRGLGAFTFEDGTTKFLAKEGTAVYSIGAGNWSTTISGYSPSDAHDVYFTMFKNAIIVTSSAYIAPLKWSGSGAFATLGGSPPSAMLSVVHKGRLWLLRTSADPSRAYFSAVNNHEDWSTVDNAGNMYIAPGDGMIINAVVSDGDVLYISKQATANNEGAIYAVFGNGPADFQVKRVAWFGAVSTRAMVLTRQFAAVVTREGVYGLSGNQVIHLSDAIDDTLFSLTDAQRAVMCAGLYRNQLWIMYPASGSTNTKALVCDLLYARWSRYAFASTHTAAGILATHPDGTLYGAATSTTIRVIKYNTGTSDIGTTNIALYWNTLDNDFGQWYADKQVTQFFLHTLTSQTTITWTITHNIDSVDSGDSQTIVPSSQTPVKRFQSRRSEKYGRFWQFKIAETSASAAEFYGIEMEAQILPRSR